MNPLNSIDTSIICLLYTLCRNILNIKPRILFNININNVKILVTKHPCFYNNKIKKFSIEAYKSNSDKKIIQIGQQLRKVTSIYRIKTNMKKLWLPGTKNIFMMQRLFTYEKSYLGMYNILFNKVDIKYHDNYDDYDNVFINNIIFIDLFNASANNTILECIMRNTPILVNKIEPVTEYLGVDYPFYFTNLEEIPDLLNDTNIEKTYNYLKNMDKSQFTIEYFINDIVNGINMYNLSNITSTDILHDDRCNINNKLVVSNTSQ